MIDDIPPQHPMCRCILTGIYIDGKWIGVPKLPSRFFHQTPSKIIDVLDLDLSALRALTEIVREVNDD